jgi:hypothetical protein
MRLFSVSASTFDLVCTDCEILLFLVHVTELFRSFEAILTVIILTRTARFKVRNCFAAVIRHPN